MTKDTKIKAIALMSTGLDSLLAATIVRNQGIDVHGICFVFQFDKLAEKQKRGEIRKLVKPLGIPITVGDISEVYLDIFLNPIHGYGSGVNPCIDCHLFMLKKAKEMMDKTGAHFLVTGEVMGQRPMSQNKPILLHIRKTLDFGELILRPLSAKLLLPSIPEQRGWIDRSQLYDISGRSRQRQIKLAEKLGISNYPAPAGGCILTDPGYSMRVKSFFEHRGKEQITVEELKLLRFGRLFWVRENIQINVGRDELDNNEMEEFRKGRWSFEPVDLAGPLVLASGIITEDDIYLAARITSRYTTRKGASKVKVRFQGAGREGAIEAEPIEDAMLKKWQVQ